jgi:hypothetical protein
MRILQTSDWHLGRSIEKISLQESQEAFIDVLGHPESVSEPSGLAYLIHPASVDEVLPNVQVMLERCLRVWTSATVKEDLRKRLHANKSDDSTELSDNPGFAPGD